VQERLRPALYVTCLRFRLGVFKELSAAKIVINALSILPRFIDVRLERLFQVELQVRR
jgi:hypothetical protein